MTGTISRRKVVGVMGSGSEPSTPLAEAVGEIVARGGYHLLTGAGGGVMEAVARAFVAVPDRAGLSIGIVRARGDGHLADPTPSRRYVPRGPNPFVELAIFTHLPDSGPPEARGKLWSSRNHINVLTSDAVVVLPGDGGTASELELAVEYGRPTILFLGGGTVRGLDGRAWQARHEGRLVVADGPDHLKRELDRVLGEPRG